MLFRSKSPERAEKSAYREQQLLIALSKNVTLHLEGSLSKIYEWVEIYGKVA